MNDYEVIVNTELTAWQKKMMRRPGLLNSLSKKVQTKVNSWIPQKLPPGGELIIFFWPNKMENG